MSQGFSHGGFPNAFASRGPIGLSGLTMNANKLLARQTAGVVRVYAADATVSFNIFGVEHS